MKNYLAALILMLVVSVLTSCGPDLEKIVGDRAYMSSNGVLYYGNLEWPPYTIEKQEAGFIQAFSRLKNVDPALVRAAFVLYGVNVEVVNAPFRCGKVLTVGCQNGSAIVVKDNGEIYSSSVTHELAHFLQDTVLFDSRSHADVELFKIARSYEFD